MRRTEAATAVLRCAPGAIGGGERGGLERSDVEVVAGSWHRYVDLSCLSQDKSLQ